MPLIKFQISDLTFRFSSKFWSRSYFQFPFLANFFFLSHLLSHRCFQFYPYMVWYRHIGTRFRITQAFRSWYKNRLPFLGKSQWYVNHPIWRLNFQKRRDFAVFCLLQLSLNRYEHFVTRSWISFKLCTEWYIVSFFGLAHTNTLIETKTY